MYLVQACTGESFKPIFKAVAHREVGVSRLAPEAKWKKFTIFDILTTFSQIKPLTAVQMSCSKFMYLNYSQSFMYKFLETGQKVKFVQRLTQKSTS